MSKQVLTATTLALLVGVSTFSIDAALAQNGGDARSNDRQMQKKLDDRELTPIRPIRRVGEDNWPAAKDQPAATRETTGQSAKQEEKKDEPAKQDTAKQDTAKDSKQESVKQETAKQESKPEPKQEDAKQDTAAAKVEAKVDAKADAKPEAKPQDSALNKDTDSKDGKSGKGFASIRLGTDESGRVAVNDAQERQIATALRKHRIDTVNVKVSVGSVAPANVRVVAVSSDMVDVLPQFRGYSYFVTREEIVVVAPSTRKVIALIPLKLTATASRSDDAPAARTETQRTETKPTTKTVARPVTKPRERTVTVGRSDGIPTREEILAAPVARGPAGTTVTRSYEYYEPDDGVVVIERRRPRFFRMW